MGRTNLVLAAVTSMLAGCAGYQLGETAPLPFRTLHVAAPVNASLAPQAAALLGSAVIREIDEAGRAVIAPEDSADAVLLITLTRLDREISADRADDTGLARKWRLTLTAECTLKDNRAGGAAYFERRPVSAFDEIYTDSGQVTTEYQNMPVLVGRLAEAIGREVLSVW
jgi:outer membrane lipopolysaccharide assembly protein LptE/RlpB